MSGLKIIALVPLAAAIELPGGLEKLGIIGLLLVAVGALWRDSAARQKQLVKIIESNTAATSSTAEVLREVRDAIVDCRRRS